MAYNTLLFEEHQAVGILKFNRPQALNALNQELLTEFNQVLDQIEKNKNLRGLILTGMSEKAFIAGADIKEINQLSSDEAKHFALHGQKTLSRLENLHCATIAAVNGFALGGGLEMALACDFIWASSSAKLGLPEVSLGIIPGYGGTQRLARTVGIARAREIIFSGQFYGAQDALMMGLVQKVIAPELLLPETIKMAELISSRGPLAIAAAKRSINQGYEQSIEDGLLIEASEFAALFRSEDQKEGTKAFVEKRTAQFKGK